MTVTLQGIFQDSFNDYASTRQLPLKHYKAAHAIMSCRTPAQGGQIQQCPDGHESHIQHHSCRHRSCPQCNEFPKEQWLHKQQSRLLDVDHYHLIFTLPHELLPVWQYNKRWFAHALFQAVSETVMTLSKDSKYLGAATGLLLSLHTWGRNLSLHPHIHCLMPAGGLTDNGQWIAAKKSFLFPSRVVRSLYKGKFLSMVWAAYHAQALTFASEMDAQSFPTVLKHLGKKKWNVRIQSPYAHGRGVIQYLARYVKGGPISNKKILSADDKQVVFSYTDHLDGKRKIQPLSTHQFIVRILEHVAEPNQHTIRHYGLYGLQAKEKRNLCRAQLHHPPEKDIKPLSWIDYLAQLEDPISVQCSHCGKPLVPGGTAPKISINKVWGSGYVQQAVQADTATSAMTSQFRVYNDSGGGSCTGTVQLN
ncbi:IS91 family transposase [Pseudomonadota bacterium]